MDERPGMYCDELFGGSRTVTELVKFHGAENSLKSTPCGKNSGFVDSEKSAG